MKAKISTETPIWLALNKSKVLNNEESKKVMDEVGPRVCITTATFFEPMMEEAGWRDYL